MEWTVVTYKLPAEPSRHRVAVWRELRKVGAVALQQGTWALPARRDFAESLSRVVDLVEAAGGEAFVFEAGPRDEATAARLEEAFNADREEEWTEFLAECDKFDREIDKEESGGGSSLLPSWTRRTRTLSGCSAGSRYSAPGRVRSGLAAACGMAPQGVRSATGGLRESRVLAWR